MTLRVVSAEDRLTLRVVSAEDRLTLRVVSAEDGLTLRVVGVDVVFCNGEVVFVLVDLGRFLR